ncbi:MAG TPA: single-stranded DNA-binding protein [Candidatus Kapabacteria bacterium]|nr:single-stranded DNA-binding protein [Candidatus Kapabacteria bacterium]
MASRSLNKVLLIGNLGKDPELRYTANGQAVATFTLATNESWKDKEGNLQERTEWHNIVAWQRLAEICGEYLKKGKKVYVEGRLQTRNFEDKEGMKRYVTEIVCDDLIMLDGRPAAGGETGASAPHPAAASAPVPAGTKADDLPF